MQPNQPQQQPPVAPPPQPQPQPAAQPVQPQLASQPAPTAPTAQNPAVPQPTPAAAPQYSQQTSMRSGLGRRPNFNGAQPDNDLASLISAPSPQPKPGGGIKKVLIIVAGIVALLAGIGALVYFLFFTPPKEKFQKVTIENVSFTVPNGWKSEEKSTDTDVAYAYFNGEDAKASTGYVYVRVAKESLYAKDEAVNINELREFVRSVYDQVKKQDGVGSDDTYGPCTKFSAKDIILKQEPPKDVDGLQGLLQYESRCMDTGYQYYAASYVTKEGKGVLVFVTTNTDKDASLEGIQDELLPGVSVVEEKK